MARLAPLLALTAAATLSGQAPDSLFTGRHCDRSLFNLRMPSLSDVVDSSALVNAIRNAAGSDTVSITLTYNRDGTLKSLQTRGTGSRDAQRTLDSLVRTATHPLPALPKKASIVIVWLRAENRQTLVFAPVTCPPEQGSTAAAKAFIIQGAGALRGEGLTALVQFVLEPTGDISRAWIAKSSGFTRLDSLALVAVHMIHYKPPLVGRTPEQVVMQQPFTF